MFTKRPNIPLPNHKAKEGKTKFSINLDSALKRKKQTNSKDNIEKQTRSLEVLPSWDPIDSLEPDNDYSNQECKLEEKNNNISSPKKSIKNPATLQIVMPEERMPVTSRTFRTQRTKEAVKENRPVAEEVIIQPTRCSDEGTIDCAVLLSASPIPCSSKTKITTQLLSASPVPCSSKTKTTTRNVPNKVSSEMPKKKRRRRGPKLNLPRRKNKNS